MPLRGWMSHASRARAGTAAIALSACLVLGAGGIASSQSPGALADVDDLTFAIAGNPPSMFIPNAWTTGTGTVSATNRVSFNS